MDNLEQQYQDAKERHPGMLLLFRVGDFYELFGEDAETAAQWLGLTLTRRDGGLALAGFPQHLLEAHLRMLLHYGERVRFTASLISPRNFYNPGVRLRRIFA